MKSTENLMTSLNEVKIIYVNYGLAGKYENTIKINKKLQKDEELLKFVIRHELDHDDSIFSIRDYLHEFKIKPKIFLKLLKFIVLNPSTWYEILPFYYTREEGLVYDLNITITYLLFIVFIMFVLKWLKS